MNTDNREAVDAAHAVTVAQAALGKLLAIEKMLDVELPAAQAALARAEKRLRELTRPSKASIRGAELETLRRKLNEVKENA